MEDGKQSLLKPNKSKPPRLMCTGEPIQTKSHQTIFIMFVKG